MASVKATFTLDETTVARLAQTAERLRRAKSAIVREAILDYSERIDRLGERERLSLLRTFDELHGAALWTLNGDDFDDLPDLSLITPG